MPRLDEDAGKGTEEDLVVREPEAVDIRALAELHLLLEGDANIVQLGLDLRIILGEGRETGEGTSSLLVLATLDEPTGRLGEQQDQSGENDSWDDLNAERCPPLAVVIFCKSDIGA